ncbi:hypothetical protein [Streptomyces neyagawaensis]|uniref:S1 motif domain-containing protein n=1 Tax=Streptomyces neyagawaensis TaxID=42238 RepID=A0ABV3B6W1_9ACTN
MSEDRTWSEAKAAYPVGARLRGTVQVKRPFGLFLKVEDVPETVVFLDIGSYNPDDAQDSPPSLPEPGDTVEGVVVRHVDRDRQLRIRVGRPFWEDGAEG